MDLPDVLLYDDDEIDEINLIHFGIPRKIYQRADHFNNLDALTFIELVKKLVFTFLS